MARILGVSPGRTQGSDIRSGLAQVADFSGLVGSYYDPKIEEADLEIKLGKLEKKQREKAIQDSLNVEAEALIGRLPAVRKEVNRGLADMQSSSAFLNEYNINPLAPIPSAVAQNPQVVENYQRFQNARRKIAAIADAEKRLKEEAEIQSELVKKGEAEWANSAFSTLYLKQSERRKALLNTPLMSSLVSGLSVEDRNTLADRILASYDSQPGVYDSSNLKTLQKVDLAKLIRDNVKELVSEGTLEQSVKGGWVETASKEVVTPKRIMASVSQAYTPDVMANTTAGEDVSTMIHMNNIAAERLYENFIGAYERLPVKRQKEIAESLGIEGSLIGMQPSPEMIERLFSLYGLDDRGGITEGQMVNQTTGAPVKVYANPLDYETHLQFLGDGAVVMYAVGNQMKKIDPSAYGLMATRKALNQKPERILQASAEYVTLPNGRKLAKGEGATQIELSSDKQITKGFTGDAIAVTPDGKSFHVRSAGDVDMAKFKANVLQVFEDENGERSYFISGNAPANQKKSINESQREVDKAGGYMPSFGSDSLAKSERTSIDSQYKVYIPVTEEQARQFSQNVDALTPGNIARRSSGEGNNTIGLTIPD